MLSSFRDLLQVSGFIYIPVSFTILSHHLIGNKVMTKKTNGQQTTGD
jgi:hypothetical protein